MRMHQGRSTGFRYTTLPVMTFAIVLWAMVVCTPLTAESRGDTSTDAATG